MDFLLPVMKEFGPTVTILIFFIWRDFNRERHFMNRIENLEAYQKNLLTDLVEKTTVALTQSSECIKWIGRVLEYLVRVCPRMVGQNCEKPENLK
jgi:hypothetical protein